MYKLILFLLLPCVSLFGQSPTTWEVYELFSSDQIPMTTKSIQQYLPGYSVYKIQSNDRKASLHALIDANDKVNALIFESPDFRNQMTRLVIPTPNSGADVQRVYKQDRAFKLSETQKSELLDLIANFSILTYQEVEKPSQVILVAETFDEPEMEADMRVEGVEKRTTPVAVLKTMVHPSCKIELTNRYVEHQSEIENVKGSKGAVTLKICVKANGEVFQTKFTQKGSTTLDKKLIEMAKENAASLKFNPGTTETDCGTITYFFNP